MKIRGKDVILYVYRSGVPVLTACATNVSKTLTAEKINITTADSDRENEYVGGSTDADFTLEGVITIDQPTSWQETDFEDNIGETVRIILIYTDSGGSTLSYDMNVLITEVSDSNPVEEYSTFSVSMTRSGKWIKLFNASGILVDGFGNPILDSLGNYIYVF